MSVIEFLSQPLWQRLGLTLLHFLWQGLAIAVMFGLIIRLLRLRRGNNQYVACLLAFVVMMTCPVVTFLILDSPTKLPPKPIAATPIAATPIAATPIAAQDITEPIASSWDTPGVFPAEDTRTEKSVASPAIAESVSSIPLRERIAGYLHTSLPWAISAWLIGVFVLNMRLLMGFIGVHRWRRRLEPLPENLLQRVTLLADRLGLRSIARVFVSHSAVQAVAIGYFRPMVLLPAAMVTQMPPEMLEAVIAHELAHIRRFDLWINLLQRVIETLLFYHPAVWWLSHRLRSERELCCDELAVEATGQRLTYASTLAQAGQAKLTAAQAALTAGLGRDRRPTLSRVRHVLGVVSKPQTGRFWFAGIITVLVLTTLAVPTVFLLRVKAEAKVQIEEKGPWGEEVRGLSCSIEMESRELRVGDPVTIQVNIKNTTNDAVNFYYQDLYIAENLIIENQKGKVIDSNRTRVYNWPHPKKFIRLIEPGQTFTHQIKGRVKYKFLKADQLRKKTSRPMLIDFHDVACHITETGDFTVRLRLTADENTVARVKDSGINNIWTGTLQSNQVTFNVQLMQRKELDKAIDALRNGSDKEKSEAIEVLAANADKKAIKRLIETLKVGRGLHIRKAADALVRIQDTSIIPELMSIYDKPAPYAKTAGEFKQIVLSVIRGLEDKQKVNEQFVKILKSGASVDESSYAVWELAMANYEPALPVMIELAKKHEPRMQWAAIDALGNFGTRLKGENKKLVLKNLLEIMKNDPDSRVRHRAVPASSLVGGDSVSGELIKALNDTDQWVANSAAIYLGRYGGPEAIAPLNEYINSIEKEQFKKRARQSIKFIRQRNKDKLKGPDTNGTVMCFSRFAHNQTNRTTVFL